MRNNTAATTRVCVLLQQWFVRGGDAVTPYGLCPPCAALQHVCVCCCAVRVGQCLGDSYRVISILPKWQQQSVTLVRNNTAATTRVCVLLQQWFVRGGDAVTPYGPAPPCAALQHVCVCCCAARVGAVWVTPTTLCVIPILPKSGSSKVSLQCATTLLQQHVCVCCCQQWFVRWGDAVTPYGLCPPALRFNTCVCVAVQCVGAVSG